MPETPADQITTMAELRGQIDRVDAALMDLLADRWAYTERAADLKRHEGIAAAAPARAQAVIARVRADAEARGMDPDMVAAMWSTMIETVIARETALIGTEGKDA